jgi:hypothetical protein
MTVQRAATSLGLVLLSVTALSACGGEVQSENRAQDATPDAAPAAQVETPAPAPAPEAQPAVTPTRAPSAQFTERPPRPTRPAAVASSATPRTDGGATAPEEPVAPAAEPEVRALEAGRTLELRVEAELSTKASKVGDEFIATVTDDVLGSAGEVLLPMGTQFKGRVADSRESAGSDQPAVLTLEVESVTVNGDVRPLKATVTDLEVKAEARDSGGRTAAKVGVGAAAGAVVGRILGRDREGAIKGAVVGAAAGGAAAIATRDGHATVEPGARMMIRLDERLILND